jgi:hypothetical protein
VKLSQAPAHIQQRINELGEEADAIERERKPLADRLEYVTKLVRGKIDDPRVDYREAEVEFHSLSAQLQKPAGRGSPWTACLTARQWLETLPADAQFEQATVTLPDGADLALWRKRITAGDRELQALRSAPTPRPDIGRDVDHYVRELAASLKPTVSGVGAGEALSVRWPMPPQPTAVTIDMLGDIPFHLLALAALIGPSEMADRILAVVDEQANKPIPVAERPKRIAELEAELETLAYQEEQLVLAELAAGRPVERRSDAPAWAILGVRVVQTPAQPVETRKARVA